MPRLKTSDDNIFGGSWSLKKLDCVADYLDAYLNVFKNMDWADLWYIDAFCGSGFQGIKSTPTNSGSDEEARTMFVEGSAIRALRLALEKSRANQKTFSHFVFIEYDASKLQALRNIVTESFPEQIAKCNFVQGDVNKKLPECLEMIDWAKGRAVCFLDPCAAQLEWKTMEAFKDTCADVWCLFPIEAIMRMLPTKHIPDDSWSKRLDLVFGDTSWRNLYCQPYKNQPNLFGEIDESYERDEGIEQVISYVMDRYKTIFPGVVEPGVLRGAKNNPLFALFALTANKSERAIKLATKIAQYLTDGINKQRC